MSTATPTATRAIPLMIVDNGRFIRKASAPTNGAIAIPAIRPQPPAQPIPLERISGG
ncbi:hypothetical protein D3C83_240590 [compost metagenome]